MNIDKKLENGRLTLKVAGRLDTNTSPELEAELKFDGVTETVFDFSGLEYISSAGLRILMVAHKAMAACGGRMSVANPNAIVKGVFDITGMSSAFNIVEG
ncbi:MAG: STAS domain-containing protein [Kiritimatiellae bacterium]|nr:STAS domain-containing protein [Kiritimatiellia bacterium]